MTPTGLNAMQLAAMRGYVVAATASEYPPLSDQMAISNRVYAAFEQPLAPDPLPDPDGISTLRYRLAVKNRRRRGVLA